jgi:hypothetical protein
MVMVTTGSPRETGAPTADLSAGAADRAALTQSTQWTPTAAGTWQEGHTGRWQR